MCNLLQRYPIFLENFLMEGGEGGHELEKRGFCAPLFRSRMTKYLSISRLFLFDRSTKVAAVSVSDDKSILNSMVLLCLIPTRLMTYHDEAHLSLASNDPFPPSQTFSSTHFVTSPRPSSRIAFAFTLALLSALIASVRL
jgi:hypothetical protein